MYLSNFNLINGVVKMKFCIKMRDLAANAMIEILKKDERRRYVTFEELDKYGMEVVKILNKNNEGAVLVMSRDETNALFRDYSDFFEPFLDGVGICQGIRLIEGKNFRDLIYGFRGYLALDVLMAFIDEQAVNVLAIR